MKPPLLWAVLGEGVLHQKVGGSTVIREQLAHLLSYQNSDDVQVQVMPFSAGVHAGLSGSFTLLSFDDQADVAYTEGDDEGWIAANSSDLKARSLRCDLVRASALSLVDSAGLIARVMEERYGHDPENGPSSMA